MQKLIHMIGVCALGLSACGTNPLKGYSETPKHLPSNVRLAQLPHYQKDCHKNMDEYEHLIRTNPAAAYQKAMQVNQRLRNSNISGTVCYHVPGYMHRFNAVMRASKAGR